MNRQVKIRPDRYKKETQARAYHDSFASRGSRERLSLRLEFFALRKALRHAVSTESILDAPCGTGRIDHLLRTTFQTVTGIDSSTSMLGVYLNEVPGRRAVCSNIFDLPFADDSFDWVLCHRYFHHLHTVDERLKLLRSLRRVCAEGVIFYAWISTPLVKRKTSARTFVSRKHINELLEQSDLGLRAVHHTSWPFSVKAVVVCSKK